MIKVKVNNEYKDVVKIFGGGTLQKEIIKVWSREAQEYVYESSVEYAGSLPITINANGEALLDYRIYGADGGVGEQTENLWSRDVPRYVYANDYKKYNPDNAIALKAGTYTISSDGQLPIIQAFNENHTQLNVTDVITYISNYYVRWDGMAFQPNTNDLRVTTITLLFDCILTFCVYSDLGTHIMLNLGSTAPTSYIPYGYKLPMMVHSENLWDRGVPIYTYANDYKKYNPNNAIALNAGTYTISSDGKLPIIQAFSAGHSQLNINDTILYESNYTLAWGGMAINPKTDSAGMTTITVLVDCILTFAVSGNYGTYLMLTEGSTAPTEYIPYSKQSVPIYIGSDLLDKDEYVDFGEQKIYRYIGDTLTPTDPPVPLPEIPTVDGTTIIDYDGTPKPSQMYVKYRR